MTPFERLLNKFPDARHTSNGWSARCPAHDDQRASLSIAESNDGKALVKCHAGCTVEAICEAADLCVKDLMPIAGVVPAQRELNKKGKSSIVATYDYRDEAGDLLFQAVRYEPKDFRQRKPKSEDGWDWSVKGVRVVPYRLPELLAKPAEPVFVVEGEKDCDNLASIGVLATCNAGGAGKWTAEHAQHLRGRRVILLPDNDDAGRKHVLQVAQSLQGIASSVQIVELPNLQVKGDVSDWIAAGGTTAELEQLADAAPAWVPPIILEPGPILTRMDDVKPCDVSWLWPGRIPLGRLTLLVGRPGEGKSFLTIDAAAHVTTGSPWPDGSKCPQGSVILISAEDDPADTIRPRLDAHAANVKHVHLLKAVRRSSESGPYEQMITLTDVHEIEVALQQLPDCRLIVVDPIGSFLGSRTDANQDNKVRGVLAPIAALAEKYGVAVLVVAHRRKSTGTVADDTALGSRAFTGIARAVWHLTRDPENKERRLLLPGKNNLAHEGDGLAFSITGEPARISWEPEPVSMSADEAMAAECQAREKRPGPKAEAHDAAVTWLEAALADGPRLAKDLIDEWTTSHDGCKRTLNRAKRSLSVVAYRQVTPGPWSWRIPEGGAKASNATAEKQLGDLGNLVETADISPSVNDVESKAAKITKHGTLDPDRERVTI